MNEVTFQFVASFFTGCAICGLTLLCPFLRMDKIMIGDIMLLIPGLMSTNASVIINLFIHRLMAEL